ncbi:MAG: phosphoadenylyl-sulfate reductase [Geminicoccaceae bacterium]|nr:phosphoadenylyl-sulfate reductase [Geminicoccaceae bacterium]
MGLETLNAGLDGMALIRSALEASPGKVALVSSFGAESAVLLDMVASIDRTTPVVFLDTGRHFPETLDYQRELCALLGLRHVQTAQPRARDLGRHDPNGQLHAEDADLCCHVRKTDPLSEALDGFEGWITGRKRFQGGTRTRLMTVEPVPSTGQVKLNPLAHWTTEDIRNYRRLRQLPLHPLVNQGYPSIGCAPCTNPSEGEGSRAGRWSGMDKTECGIHLHVDGSGI